MSKRTRAAAAAALTVALLGTSATTPSYADPNNNTVRKLTKAVTADGVLEHLAAFQEIADEHGDRAAGRPGYEASVDYVVEQLEAAGYAPDGPGVPVHLRRGELRARADLPPAADLRPGLRVPAQRVRLGHPRRGGHRLPLRRRAGGTTSGCESHRLRRNASRLHRAHAARRVRVPVQGPQRPGRGRGWRHHLEQHDRHDQHDRRRHRPDDPGGVRQPGGRRRPGQHAGCDGPGRSSTSRPSSASAYNVLAETENGRDDNVVMAGAHLDSVQDGAGINDNGSGSASLLETAIQMAKVKPTNTVRFAWWGAEEEGLLGSEYYVEQLTEAAGSGHRALPELRHGRLAQLHVRHLRRRQLRRHRGAGLHPSGLGRDRGRVRAVLREPG